MKKVSLAVMIVPVIILSTLTAYLYLDKVTKNNLLLEYKANVQRLLSQVKSISEEKIAQEKELVMLKEEINRLNFELATNSQPSIVTEESPLSDYQEKEEEMRQRIIYEYELDRSNKPTLFLIALCSLALYWNQFWRFQLY